MEIILHKNKLIAALKNQKKIGFVPTMGAIHKGHISLIKKSKTLCSITLVSIFVNKPQFNNTKDYKTYPRLIKKDISLLKKNKVDILYLPNNKQIYPEKRIKRIKIHSLKKQLCGKNRPSHFEAVANVIDRFIKIIKPEKIFMGEKDLQQLKIIENFILINKIPTKIVECKTVREKNGIAYSSRNFLLTKKQKKIASKIYKLILRKKIRIIKKKYLIKKLKKEILSLGAKKIDYLKIVNINKLIKPYKEKNKYKLFIAYYLGGTRLIDNI